MKKLLDLRFVIGMFFLIVGALLCFYHFVGVKNAEMSTAVNIWTGIVFVVFGALMVFLSYSHIAEDDETTITSEN